MTEAPSVRREEVDLMAIALRKRFRSRRASTLARPLDDITEAERAAMTALAETLGHLAEGLPDGSRLAVEFVKIARSIDSAGVLGTWRLDTVAREFAEGTN